ncbi:MAG: YcbK family protein [Flavobacteriaceae bacterium]
MKLTKNFSRQEFDCKDGTIVPRHLLPNLKELAENLQVLREYLGVPVQVTGSGYRTRTHNKRVGGTKNSLHLEAKAADINAKGLTPKQLYDVIEKSIAQGKMKQGGLGLYPTFVHYDIRGTKTRW